MQVLLPSVRRALFTTAWEDLSIMSLFTDRKLAAVVAVLALAACDGWSDPAMVSTAEPVGGMMMSVTENADAAPVSIQAIMDDMNDVLAADGAEYRVGWAEYITDVSGGGSEAGQTVLSKVVGNKQLVGDFVPGDTRRTWSSPDAINLTYAIDQTGDAVPPFGGLTGAQTDAAIVRAMNTWDAETCSDLGLVRNTTTADIGYIARLNNLGGSFAIAGDVQHAGFRDINFAGNILGVTFTLIFVSGGVPTDINGDGQADVAFREIYYDPSWNWRDNGVSNIDLQSVSVHESGHGLSQSHFGTVALKNDGRLQASPRAVMNALYSSPFRELTGTDNGGHCSNWAAWPNK